jgi:hypothetical protein
MHVEGSPATERVRLTLPHEERFFSVARIVVGGLAARLDLPFESLDDVQLAVEAVLSADRYRVAEHVTVEIEIEGRRLSLLVGPVDAERAAADLEDADNDDDDGLSLRVLLGAVVDTAAVERRDGAGWLRLEKHVPIPAGS